MYSSLGVDIPLVVIEGWKMGEGSQEWFDAIYFSSGICATNSNLFTIEFFGRIVPGDRTAFAPTLELSPTNAPNFSVLVSIIFPKKKTEICLSVRSL